ncbi:MAG: hypothetical protein ACSHX7_14035 [Luteolibacter sp.]
MKMKLTALAITTVAIGSLFAQDQSKDPFKSAKAGTVAKVSDIGMRVISICYEDFSLPLATAAKLQREQLPDSELYAQIVNAVEKETAKQESFVILRGKSGQKIMSKGVKEEIYPTEYEPALMPDSVGVSIAAPKVEDKPLPIPDGEKLKGAPISASLSGLRSPATATSFQTRNAGLTIEAEPTLSKDGKMVDLRILPEHVDTVDRSVWGQEISTLEMATFESQQILTSATLSLNSAYLLGTINRPSNSEVDPDSANRVWFAFITVTLAKP